jgi:opacity protein-like surface antigen
MHMFKKVAIAVAIATAFPGLAMAQSTKSLKAELEALKAHVKVLETMIEKVSADAGRANAQAAQAGTSAAAASVQAQQAVAQAGKAEQASAGGVDVAEFNRMRIKAEAAEEAAETSGFKNLKVSGYIDPTYIYNRNAKTSSVVFLNNNSSINGSGESFGYDNSLFGSGQLTFEKELEGGTKVKVTLMPSKSLASGYNFGNMVHEAFVSVPLDSPATRLIAGQLADWTGYEAIPSNQNKLITHNLMFDFSAGSIYTGAGVELVRGAWDTKIVLGNLNSARIDTARQRAPGLFYRSDYSFGEFSGIGFSGIHTGFNAGAPSGRLDLMEVDGFYTRGDWNFQGQVGFGRQGATESNGYVAGKQNWYGLSSLVSYKVMPRLDAIARFDFINNARHGGGVYGSTLGVQGCFDTVGVAANCPDGRNGFGSSMVFDGTDWVAQDPMRGTNRSALSLGLNYALMPGVQLKGEYRYDRSTGNVFQNADGQYLRDNHVLGVSTVVSF